MRPWAVELSFLRPLNPLAISLEPFPPPRLVAHLGVGGNNANGYAININIACPARCRTVVDLCPVLSVVNKMAGEINSDEEKDPQ